MIMGILNVTPDSFSDGGRFRNRDAAVAQALRMIEEGADIIDIGGESSRPGAEPVSAAEESSRIIPVIESLRAKSDIPVSIDTCKAEVARTALEAGGNWINDISGLQFDPEMVSVAVHYRCPVVVMHMQGEPRTMQQNPCYDDVVAEVGTYFEERINALQSSGIEKIIIDPGIGFGKRLEDNLMLLRHLGRFRRFGVPLLIGVSRKSFIGALTGRSTDDREAGTLAANILACRNGADILRTHRVGMLQDALKIVNAISGNVNHI